MATVYKAHQAALSRYVAIKILPPHLAAEPNFEERFRDEAVRLAALRHASIPAVFDYGTTDAVTFIASDYIDGGTLSEQLGRPLPLEYTCAILAPIASALDYAHSRGVVHRDVKPSNILLTRDGTPILTDFGIARMMASDTSLTQTGMILGTPQYMAPEQGAGDTSPAADIYSLGVVAYHMLTGRVPFDAATPMAVVLAHQQEPLPLPRTVNPNLSPEIETVLLKVLSRDPTARYRTAAAFVRALSVAVEDAPAAVAAVATVPLQQAAAPAVSDTGRGGRSRLALLMAAGVALLVVAAVAAVVLTRPRANTPAPAPVADRVGRWQQWVHMPSVLDIAGTRSDGRLLVAANGQLQLLGLDGSFGTYSPAYKVDPGPEAYITVSHGLTMTQPACTFPADNTYALRVGAPGVTTIDPQGKVGLLAAVPGVDGLNGITFDTVGKFGHSLLVTGGHAGVTVVTAIDCQGKTRVITSQAPTVEGGLEVAPSGFGPYGGQLIAPDEVSGRIMAIGADGSATVVVASGLPTGADIGVESAAFVPTGFMRKGGFAYVADRATAKNAHPGTDSVLRISSADLAAAGVKDGDLLVVTEGGSLTIGVRCASTCTAKEVATGPDVAHGEGHVAFTLAR
ncbi:MAG: eukaryotic-like serine/threonine-protein kinase [Chloroflexota bacterium]|nr:eukaryotic-like serine/threonine-protein kinase [Chloroflexota bacterium]